MSTRLKFDGLPDDTHTFVLDGTIDDNGVYELRGQVQVNKDQIIEVEDLNHPHDLRAKYCRDHIAKGHARVLEEKAKKGATGAASSAGVSGSKN